MGTKIRFEDGLNRQLSGIKITKIAETVKTGDYQKYYDDYYKIK